VRIFENNQRTVTHDLADAVSISRDKSLLLTTYSHPVLAAVESQAATMDPISITGTIIAVLQITSSVISICYDYRGGVESASREAIQITNELNSLRDVLESLLRVVEKSQSNNGKDGSSLATFELLTKEGGPLMTCKTELERLKSRLEPENGWRKMRSRLVWPLKEGEVRRTLDGLERLKGTMGLALSADQA
jgi:hypothetical protein